jgi:hypothetical protein
VERPPQEGFWRVFAGIGLLPISGTDKAVLTCLADCANSKTGACWPKQETIARAVGKDLRAVKRSISNLLDTPYLRRKRRRMTSNLYEIKWNAILDAFDVYKERRAKKSECSANTRKSASKTTEKAGDNNVTNGVTKTSPKKVSKASPNKENSYKEKKKRNPIKASPQGSDGKRPSLHPPTDEVANVGGVLAQFERAFKRDPGRISNLEGWRSWLEDEGEDAELHYQDPTTPEGNNAQRAKRLADEVSSHLDDDWPWGET